MKILAPAAARALIADRIRKGVDVTWFENRDQALAAIVDADAAWLDTQADGKIPDAERHAPKLRWLMTMAAGVEHVDHAYLRERGITLTNGSGLNADNVADYAVMGVLVAAKRYDKVVRLAHRHEWTDSPPGRGELSGSNALVIGYGTIGQMIGDRLAAFGVRVTGVTRSGRDGTIAGDAWRAKLGDFDWVILAAPSTDNTRAMIGAQELAAMKPTAWLVNIARGTLIDNAALIAALEAGRIGGAFLDTVDPEPLPPGDPLWSAPNVLHSMHLSGRSQTSMFARAADLFADNLSAFLDGRPMRNVVDLDAGY
ncbi:D-2-hydroxyacid dehydrogenase [Sphingomonas immobilis]|uniref:D-2-hydroxyacid dehydrogenase n=1 Tax=Sphingomonas immobilis TaxID=3063997 RepID=A0ABT8ZZ75_9SPHN|nr:D-2-hydroxyacid dehydrogenase [Sphingomonas sp. CA1-15]MDO7842492.1 D-2-hydroxyacid dehydrogenase [Sphingomonas sp. CA1-15]